MASLAVASSVNVAAAASSFTGAKVSSASRNAAVSVKMAPIRAQAKSDAEVLQRRALVAGAAAAALALVASAPAFAGGVDAPAEKGIKGPKPGSKEALKMFRNICVCQPTASICHG
ncbi:unnamed protein product [Calypogeia fissa]